MNNNFIDYSQYRLWQHCPWAWYERYVLRRQRRWPEGMRDDALAIGTLVHSGLECWYSLGKILIPEATIVKINPTPECQRLCERLLWGYVETFVGDTWLAQELEEPLRFKLLDGVDGLAKIDRYFYIDKPTIVESGLQGYKITLNPGWWIQEYKTKGPGTTLGDFMKSWTTNMQADFQMMALRGQIDNLKQMGSEHPINGLLVNVIDKPKDYIPRRKCQKCEEYYPFSSWVPAADLYACGVCGNRQKLKPVEMREPEQARYFRVIVERTAEQLKHSHTDIHKIAERMTKLRNGCKESDYIQLEPGDFEPPNRENCFNSNKRWGKECEFFNPHTYGFSTVGHQDYEDTEDYINEPTPTD